MTTDLLHGDPECRYKHLTARVAPSIDPDAAIDVACFMSTDTVDADDEVLLPEGVDLSRFDRNPVVMLCHSYGQPGCYYPLPVGKAEWTKKRPRGILAGVRFTDRTAMGREIKALFDDDMLRSFSVGFIPRDASPMTRDEAGSRPDWHAAYERTKGRILVHRSWHLLELSVAPVPSNPDALDTRYRSKGIAVPSWLQLPSPRDTSMTEPAAQPGSRPIVQGVAVYHPSPAVDGAWDAPAALASVRAWASANGSGATDSMAWDRYAQAFLWSDNGPQPDFGAYRLPVKRVEGNRLVVVREALRAAAAALDGGLGGAEIPESDLAEVRSVLSRYESDAGIGEPAGPDASSPTPPSPATPLAPEAGNLPPMIGIHDPVRIAAPDFEGFGLVVSLHGLGLVPDVPNDVLGTRDEPAARVQCYKAVGGGFVPTAYHVGVLCQHLETIAPLPSPVRSGEKTSMPRLAPAAPECSLPPLVPLTEQQVLDGAIANLDRLLRPESIRQMVRTELDRRMGYV